MRRLQTIRPRFLKVALVILILAALVDSYALARGYVESNADTVVITAIIHFNGAPFTNPQFPRRLTLRYTDAIAGEVQRVLEYYDFHINNECLVEGSGYSYSYHFTFTLAGFVTETADTQYDSCVWTFNILGHTSVKADVGSVQLLLINRIIGDALPI